MKKILFPLVSLFLLSFSGWAQIQPPDTLWMKAYGGNGDEQANCIEPTSDGGYIVVGWTNSFGAGGFDVLLLKIDSLGNRQWYNIYGGIYTEFGYGVQQTSDGGYIAVGNTTSFGAGSSDVYLIKTDAQGNQQWYRTFGGLGYDFGSGVLQTSDGGYIIVGATASFGPIFYDLYLIKTDAFGNQLWFRTYGGYEDDEGSGIQLTSDGGYIIVGTTASFGPDNYNVYLLKTDSFGNLQWSRTFGGDNSEYGQCVRQTSDGGYIIVGQTYSFGTGGSDVYLIKTDTLGYEQWSYEYGGIDDDVGYCVQQTSDSGYIITGFTTDYITSDYSYVYLIKTDVLGNQQWHRTWEGTCGARGKSVLRTSDNGYLVAGYTSCGLSNFQAYLIRLEGIPFPVNVTLIPDTLPIIIPVGGGTFGYTIEVANSGSTTRSFNIWMDILKPDGSVRPVLNSQVFSLAGGATLTHHLTQNVPAWTSAGVYWNRAFLGANVYNVLSADSFQFTKSETYDSENFPIENWILSGWEDNLIPENPYPLSFILYPCQPNPFNSKTSLKFSLPEGGEVKIEIFDITGRLITTLTEGDYPVGNYNITWDAFEFASGIYFARLQVGKFTQTQKLLLMK